MSIPRIPSPGTFSGKHWCESGNGKGDTPRNNNSEEFRNNYDQINWHRKPGPKPKNGHTHVGPTKNSQPEKG